MKTFRVHHFVIAAIAIVVILLIATTIVLTIWSTPIRRVPQRRR